MHAVQRSHCGKGVTGTPIRAAYPFGSVSVPGIHGAARSSLDERSSIRPLTSVQAGGSQNGRARASAWGSRQRAKRRAAGESPALS